MLVLSKEQLQDVRENYHGNTRNLAKKYCTDVRALMYLARKHGFASKRKRSKQGLKNSETEFFDIDNFQIY